LLVQELLFEMVTLMLIFDILKSIDKS
jgi:hypothetical protein